MVKVRSPYQDPLRAPQFKVMHSTYEYRPYNPNNHGIHGQERTVYQRPPQPAQKPKIPKPKVQKPKRTFESGRMGPGYKVHEYQYIEYIPPTPYKPPVTDRHKSMPAKMYKGDVYYKLDKNNNYAMRNWDSRYVKRPQEKYREKAQPNDDPRGKPVLATVAPIPMKRTPLPPPVKKSFRTTTTQTEASKTQTLGTQYEYEKAKNMSVQTDYSLSLLAGTQSDGPMRTSTKQIAPVQERTRTPQYAASYKRTPSPKRRSPSPRVASDTRWTPSPEVNETVYSPTNATPSRHFEPVNVFIPAMSEPLPQMKSYPDAAIASRPNNNYSGNGMFPYQSSQSRLPPEITACIEAYDCAHGP